ncbi:MAG: hypothetical protein V3U76_01850 [Granulosicoccus sp.]
MANRRTSILHAFLLCLLVTALTWPLFILVASTLGHVNGEAWLLDAWALDPQHQVKAYFLNGWIKSLPVAAALGVVALIDYQLLSRYRVTWIIAGILLPTAGAGIAFAFYGEPMNALPALALTGLALAIVYRLFDSIARWFRWV